MLLKSVYTGVQNEDEMAGMATHQRKASNVYGGSGPPQKSPRLWKFAPARGGNANNTGVLPFEAVSILSPACLLPHVVLTDDIKHDCVYIHTAQ